MNFYYPWIDPRVKRVYAQDLVAYFQKRNWPEEVSDLENFLCYRHPTKRMAVYVPTFELTDDSPLRILEAVTQLAKIEERYAGAVLDDLLTPKLPEAIALVKPEGVSHQPVQS